MYMNFRLCRQDSGEDRTGMAKVGMVSIDDSGLEI